ncbi:MAG TPA: hypothetical protein VGR95_18705 [Thermoanaerobaculia bacterium]|jgi:hypothetical protein|nr:hypothetical protein [Thermoanaerobaculia bacterium]
MLEEWLALPDVIERASATPETVHHLLEANLVASNMILAALGTDNYYFDWSWLMPDEQWTARLGYDKVAPEPAIELFRALTKYFSALLGRDPNLLQRTIRLKNSGDSEPYTITVAEILGREVEHAREHLSRLPHPS